VCPRAGVVRSALALGRPIVVAALEFDLESRRYTATWRKVAATTLAGVLDVYFGYLELWVRKCPDVWYGWHEFERFPEH
jgi:predicted LPLAT superfamily acyltransferase